MKIKTADLIGVQLDWAVAKCEGLLPGKVAGLGIIDADGFWTPPTPEGNQDSYVLQSTHQRMLKVSGGTWPWTRYTRVWNPSVDWSQGGPIIQRHLIDVKPEFRLGSKGVINGGYCWQTPIVDAEGVKHSFDSPTPLIATMRTYVGFTLGEQVEIPEELS